MKPPSLRFVTGTFLFSVVGVLSVFAFARYGPELTEDWAAFAGFLALCFICLFVVSLFRLCFMLIARYLRPNETTKAT